MLLSFDETHKDDGDRGRKGGRGDCVRGCGRGRGGGRGGNGGGDGAAQLRSFPSQRETFYFQYVISNMIFLVNQNKYFILDVRQHCHSMTH